ncbi:MAG: hypothetical protein KDB60_00570 [Propionibacteriaceae bacterium]|nr:hypothetical protein [Propionibacteriaceae bacterium]
MTTRRLLWIAVHRWYVLVLGLALVAGAAWIVRSHAPVAYWSRTVVTVLQPHSNPLHDEGSSTVAIASALVIRANGGPATTKTSSPETTLYGEGVLEGSRIRLRDLGRQWTTSIPDPVIYVEAISPSPEQTADEITTMTTALSEDLADLQDGLDVSQASRAFLQLSPAQPEVIQVQGDRTRAVGVVVLLGLVLVALALYLVDRRWPSPQRGTP